MIIFFVNKTKNIIKVTKCHFLKTSFVFGVFFEIDSIIRQLEFTKYVVFFNFFLLVNVMLIFFNKSYRKVNNNRDKCFLRVSDSIDIFDFTLVDFQMKMQFVF